MSNAPIVLPINVISISTIYGPNNSGAWTFTAPAGSQIIDSAVGLEIDNPTAGTSSWTINISGGIYSSHADGMDLFNFKNTGANTLNVSQDGSVGGTTNGIAMSAATNITNAGSIEGQTAIFISGLISSSDSSNIGYSSKLSITNAFGADITGTGSTAEGIYNASYATLTVSNAGSITGDTGTSATYGGSAIFSLGALVLTNSVTNTANGPVAGVVAGDIYFYWAGSSITNSGEIDGAITSDILEAASSGNTLVSGLVTKPGDASPLYLDTNRNGSWDSKDALLSKAVNTYINSGTITGTADFGDDNGTPYRIALTLGAVADQIKNTGIITGDILAGAGNDSLTNSGKIQGLIDMGDDNDTVTNTGSIIGGDRRGLYLGEGNNTLTNSGRIDGGVNAGAGFDTITNNAGGVINDHGINIQDGGGKVVNNGTVNGGIESTATHATDVISISNGAAGVITANNTVSPTWAVFLGSGTNTLTNAGHILDSVELYGGTDTISNTGTITGSVLEYGGSTTQALSFITNSKVIMGSIVTGSDGTGNKINGKAVQEIITNSGSVGAVFGYSITTGTGDRLITNSGTLMGAISVGQNSTSAGVGIDTINNTATGSIGGLISVNGLAQITITNAGLIAGDIDLGSGGAASITNTGHIAGDINASIGLTFTNKGLLSGGLYGNGGDTIDNEKEMGGISESTSANITNGKAGLIHGGIYMNGASSLINSGVVDGVVSIALDNNSVTNKGTITGEVHMGTGTEMFDNTAGIAVGDVYFAVGSSNTFLGGKTAEHVHYTGGDSGAFTMGDGNDTVSVAGMGGDATDFDGGKGIDTLDFSGLSGSGNYVEFDMSGAGLPGLPGTTLIIHKNGLEALNTAEHFEIVVGTQGDDTFYGSSSADTISGGGGNDHITGRGGADKLHAATTGDDTFIYTSLTDSGVTAATRDVIYGFKEAGEGDHDQIQLTASLAGVFANASVLAENTALTGVGIAQIAIIQTGTQTLIEFDANGDGKIDSTHDMTIALEGTHNLTASDFLFS